MAAGKPVIRADHLSVRYEGEGVAVDALKDVTFEVEQGEFIVVLGPSGSGKSTLLNIVGGMDKPTGGEIWYKDRELTGYTADQLSDYRKDVVGFVFQFFNLIPSLNAVENVELAASIVKEHMDPKEVLAMVGLGGRERHFPAQLSGGEQQRVSIARALAKNPKILLGDEPTGALDSETGVIVLELLQKLCKEEKRTVILVTHNADIAKCADKVIRMKNGKIREIYRNENPLSVKEVEW